jgi:hypothetical protein
VEGDRQRYLFPIPNSCSTACRVHVISNLYLATIPFLSPCTDDSCTFTEQEAPLEHFPSRSKMPAPMGKNKIFTRDQHPHVVCPPRKCTRTYGSLHACLQQARPHHPLGNITETLTPSIHAGNPASTLLLASCCTPSPLPCSKILNLTLSNRAQTGHYSDVGS